MYLTDLDNYYIMKGFVITLVLVFLAWIALTMSLSPDELLLGLIVSLIVTAISHKLLHPDRPAVIFNPTRWGNMILYVLVFLYVEVLSHLDVVKRVLTGKVKPAIVEIKTGIVSDSGKMVLGNSITLTPGTLTLRAGGNRMFIHTIGYDKRKRIGELFERYWRRASND
jgi:multicomponent Na+:H+ antiporter subunit E